MGDDITDREICEWLEHEYDECWGIDPHNLDIMIDDMLDNHEYEDLRDEIEAMSSKEIEQMLDNVRS